MLPIVGENLCESLFFHMEGVVRVHEIDVRMDIEVQGHKEQRGFGTVQIGRIQDLLDLRGDIRLLQFVICGGFETWSTTGRYGISVVGFFVGET